MYLSTSRFEGLPYALIEAASAALPIVATDVIGNNEVVINGENGFLFRDVNEGASKIKEVFYDESLRAQMSFNSKNVFLKSFTIEQMIAELMCVYKSMQKRVEL